MELGLRGKGIIVTASSKGIGFEVAKRLAEEGANIVMCSRNEDNLTRAHSEISSFAEGEVYYIKADLSKKEDIERVVDYSFRVLKSVYGLFLNAGGPPTGYYHELTDEQWQKAFELNLMSVVRLVRSIVPLMEKAKEGRVVALTSVSVKTPIDNLILSNSIRSAVTGFLTTVAKAVAKNNVTINMVAPGYTLTDRVRSLIKRKAEEMGVSEAAAERYFTSSVPMERMARPEEIADMVVFLMSERASYITGQTLFVDGGTSITTT